MTVSPVDEMSNEEKRACEATQPAEGAKKETKVEKPKVAVAKEHVPPKTQVIQPPKEQPKEQPKQVEPPMESRKIKLVGLAPVLEDDDRRPIYLVDTPGNSYTFFKYKGRLIDVPSYHLEQHIKGRPKEEIMETIRKQFVYGIKRGETVVFHIGDGGLDIDEFFKGQLFWQPEQLFRRGGAFDDKWFQTNLAKMSDNDPYDGNTNVMPYPSDKVLMIVSTSKDLPITSLPWLKPCLKGFREMIIEN